MQAPAFSDAIELSRDTHQRKYLYYGEETLPEYISSSFREVSLTTSLFLYIYYVVIYQRSIPKTICGMWLPKLAPFGAKTSSTTLIWSRAERKGATSKGQLGEKC